MKEGGEWKGAGVARDWITYLINILFPAVAHEILQGPLGEHAEFGCDEADLARAAPDDSGRPAIGH
jgi:hypothetical protein